MKQTQQNQDFSDKGFTDQFIDLEQRDELEDAFLKSQVSAAASRVTKLIEAQYSKSDKFKKLLALRLAGV